jgi:hypothetical protein
MMTLVDDPFISAFFFFFLVLSSCPCLFTLPLAPQTLLSALNPLFQTVYLVPPVPLSLNNKLSYHRSSALWRRRT